MKLFRATLVENTDPLMEGRIQFRSNHSIDTPQDQLPWAQACVPFGGGDLVDGSGFYFIPEIGAQVWIIEENSEFIWIGSGFYAQETGRQQIPIEARTLGVEPTIRMIKSSTGHKLILDDRVSKGNGDPVDEVVLENREATGLTLNEPSGNGRGIRLGFGLYAGELKITRDGLKLVSNKSAGLYVNDTYKMVRLVDEDNTAYLQLMEKKLVGFAESGILLSTNNATRFESNKGFFVKAAGGAIETRSTNQKHISATDYIVQTGGNFNVNSNQFNFTGQFGSNFVVDLPLPGIPGLYQGNIVLQSSAGGILLKNGPSLLVPGIPPITSTTFTSNDILFPTLAGRLGIGDFVSGNALLEGRLGGLFISGTPITLPGVAIGGGRLPAPGAPIVPTNFPGQPQSAVLGGNLYQFLTQFTLAMNTFLTGLTTAAPAFSTGPMGPNILSPAAVAAITALQTSLATLQQTFYSPTPIPTNILSALCFVD